MNVILSKVSYFCANEYLIIMKYKSAVARQNGETL